MTTLDFTVEHIGVAARDPVALAEWYVRVLGCRELWRNADPVPAVFVRLPGGPILEIYPTQHCFPQTADNRTAGWRHLALRVANLDTARSELTRRGVQWIDPVKPAGGGGRILFFSDLDGNLLHLVERSADSVLESRK